MECPFRMIAWASLSKERIDEGAFVSQYCSRAQCPLWNERFGMCSLAVDAYLKGQEDLLKERGK